MAHYVRRLLVGLLIVAVQWLVLGRLLLWGVFPDAVLIYIVVLALRDGRLSGSIFGFVFGFLCDLIYGTWGVQMLAKTIVGFLVGLFAIGPRDSFNLSAVQALIGGLVIALVHNGITVIFFALTAGTRTPFLIFGLWIGSAIYTAFVAFFAALIIPRR
jgi:rod shape-determining protein MreD